MAEQIEVEITGLGAQGDGLVDSPQGRLYVPFTLPGDRARVALGAKKGEGRSATLERLVKPSPDRIEPVCRHFGTCGGCALQHLAPDLYRQFKRDRVAMALAQRGLDDLPVGEPVIFEPGTRRRTRWTARKIGRRIVLGYSSRASHRLVDVVECPVLSPAIVGLLEPLKALLPRLMRSASMQVGVTETETGLDLLLIADHELDLPAREVLAGFAEQQDLARLSWDAGDGGETIVQRRAPVIEAGAARIALPPDGFLQATAESEHWMRDFALDHIPEGAAVADLFSGCGSFALSLAARGPVTAYEGDAGLVSACQAAVNRLQSPHPVRAQRRDLFRDSLTPVELNRFDAVVIDPPRAGAQAQSVALAESQVALIVAFSCNPASFARDARILVDGGYRLEAVTPVDQFRWSAHVELAAVFRR